MGLFDRFRRSGSESNVVKLTSGGDKGTLNIVAFYDAKSRSPYFFFVYYDDEAVLRTIKEKLLSGDWVLIMGNEDCLAQVIHNVYEFSKFGKDFIYICSSVSCTFVLLIRWISSANYWGFQRRSLSMSS